MTNNRETWASAPGQLPHATYDLAGAVSGVGYEGAGANPSGAVAAARLSTARLRVVVSINGGKFRVPVGDRTLSIGWLCGDVAARYARHHKLPENSVTIRELRGSDGSVLDETDAVCDVADDMEELVGVISTSHHRAEESERTEVGAFARAGSGGAPISRRTSMPEPPNGAAVRTSSDVSAIRPQMMQGLQAMLGRARSGLSSTDTDAAKAMMVQQQSGAQLNEEVLWPGACMSIEDEDLDSWVSPPPARTHPAPSFLFSPSLCRQAHAHAHARRRQTHACIHACTYASGDGVVQHQELRGARRRRDVSPSPQQHHGVWRPRPDGPRVGRAAPHVRCHAARPLV